MSDANKASKVAFDRIETGLLGNCRTKLEHIPELAASIGQQGLIQPLVCWHQKLKNKPFTLPDGQEVWHRYILVSGNRRYAAIAHIRESDPDAFAEVNCTLLEGNEDDMLFAQVTENLERDELPAVDLANAIVRFQQRGHTVKVIAVRLSKSERWVSKLAAFRKRASEGLLRAATDGKVSLRLAMELADQDEAEQLRALEKIAATVAETPSPKGKATAAKEAREELGHRRPTLTDIRGHFAALENAGTLSSRQRDARNVLAWVLGEGEWPEPLTLRDAAAIASTSSSSTSKPTKAPKPPGWDPAEWAAGARSAATAAPTPPAGLSVEVNCVHCESLFARRSDEIELLCYACRALVPKVTLATNDTTGDAKPRKRSAGVKT